MARVGVDLDGVLYPFEDVLREHIGKPQLPAAETWNFYEQWGLTRGEFVELCEEAVSCCLFQWGEPYTDSTNQVNRLLEAGHEVVFITNRSFVSVEKCEQNTRFWLDYWLGCADYELHLVADKTTVPVDYMIDDNYDNYLAMRSVGVNAFLCARPWNAHDKASQRGTLEEYVDLVLRCEERDPRLDPQREFSAGLIGEVRVTSETGGQKGTKPARFDLLPPALWEVAELYGKGAEKYDDWNWRKGYPWHLSYAAMQRHANLFWSGQDYDEETGAHHLTSVVFHALALLTFAKEHPEYDDRFKPAA